VVEHYRGHHVRAATWDDPASARRGESLWRFLPRTLGQAWKRYPQLPTGYAGCIFLAAVPVVWFASMHRRMEPAV
jgi:hypothetical protein